MTIAVLQHPEVVAFYRRALARAMRLATLESKLTAKREWQAVAGHCALRMLEIEEASGQEARRRAGAPRCRGLPTRAAQDRPAGRQVLPVRGKSLKIRRVI